MTELFHAVGTLVTADIDGENDDDCKYLIIGHRIINPDSMRVWDYVSVDFPEGLNRRFTKNRGIITFEGDDFIYFNHEDIKKIEYGGGQIDEYRIQKSNHED